MFSFPKVGKCIAFYLQANLIISPFRSDVGLIYRRQKQPPEAFYKRSRPEKETPAQMFFCEYCEIFQSPYKEYRSIGV